jgi:hypothetical protein
VGHRTRKLGYQQVLGQRGRILALDGPETEWTLNNNSLMKRRPPILPVTAKQRWAVGVHEAGHAVAGYATGFGLRPRGIELSGREGMTYTRGT